MLPGAIWGEEVPKPTGNAPRGGSIEGRPNFVWVISGDLDRFKRARVLGFIRPVVPLAGLPLYRLVICHRGGPLGHFLRLHFSHIRTIANFCGCGIPTTSAHYCR